MKTTPTLEELAERAASAAAELARCFVLATAHRTDAPAVDDGRRPLTRVELGNALAVSIATVDRWVAAGCPCVSTAPRRFDLDAVRIWAATRQPTTAREEKPNSSTVRALKSAGLRVVKGAR